LNRSRFSSLAMALCVLALAGVAAAFSWEDTTFPEGDHHYVFEMESDSLGPGVTLRVEYSYKQVGGTYDTTSVTTVTTTGVEADELADGFMGGGAGAMLMFGPFLTFYGPAAFMMPFLLGGEDIHVRSEPIVKEGIGTVYMDRTETHAGLECVVVRLELEDEDSVMEFGLAEGLPFPCFSRYGDEGDSTSMRLIEAR